MNIRERESGLHHEIHDSGYDSVRFFATLLIVIHHYITTCDENSIPLYSVVKMINLRFELGGVGVGLFFVLSGALLWKTYKEELPVMVFYKKRISRIFIPYWLAYVLVLPIVYLGTQNIFSYILNCGFRNVIPLLGLCYSREFWEQFNIIPGPMLVGEWFTTVIIILYFLFPLLHWLFKHHRITTTVFISTVFAVNLYMEVLTFHGGYFSITNGLMYFWLGMLFDEYKSKFNNCIGGIAWLIIVALLYAKPEKILWVTYLPCFFLSISTFIYIYYLCINGQFAKYVCRYNYEVYLLHHRIFLVLMPLLLNQESNQLQIGICYFLLTAMVLYLAEKLQEASKWVNAYLTKVT